MSVYIYVLICPVTRSVRYVGKTKSPATRIKTHISKARHGQCDHYCARWIKGLLDIGLAPSMEVIHTCNADECWQDVEARYIAEYRRNGCELTNLTSGGDGFHDVPAEVTARRVASFKKTLSDPLVKARWLAALTSSRSKLSVREKMSASASANWSDPERRLLRMAEMNTPQARKNRSDAAKQSYEGTDRRAKVTLSNQLLWSDPKFKSESLTRMQAGVTEESQQQRRSSLIATYSKPEVKARKAAISTEVGARPEVKAKRSASAKKNWADNRAARTEAINRPDVKAKMSQPRKAWADPVRGAGLRANLRTPEHRHKMAESAKRRATPEYRAMMAEKTRASWLKRKAAA